MSAPVAAVAFLSAVLVVALLFVLVGVFRAGRPDEPERGPAEDAPDEP